jgi:hypothetical protein
MIFLTKNEGAEKKRFFKSLQISSTKIVGGMVRLLSLRHNYALLNM